MDLFSCHVLSTSRQRDSVSASNGCFTSASEASASSSSVNRMARSASACARREKCLDVSVAHLVEGINDIVEAEKRGGGDEFIVRDGARVEVPAGVKKPAARGGGLGVDLSPTGPRPWS
ncbi:hypothetical protein LV457_16810 [Mycobacterium sp. MYCO198283]|uniref:hypothetical protein n=1 Tax=Mycobacterium sp. MYCO198283 TaxID=2883505 RepID=UPI001E2979A1|nr:hypothetical protein [Mycobacterium sp. MYCO198283]MCG5433938.1 hypothetical protein [Mycobacterium sp. MYCO198283]